MVRCPNCKIKISFRKAYFCRLYKKGCPNCGVQLRTSRACGAIVGGTGAFLLKRLVESHFSTGSVIIVSAWLILFVIFAYVFVKYEVVK